jgi:hypothetical protein
MRRWPVMALCGCAFALLVTAACGGDDDDAPATTAPGSTSVATRATPGAAASPGTTPSPGAATATTAPGVTRTADPASPLLSMPVSRYTVAHDEIGDGFLVNVAGTFNFDIESYAQTRTFFSVQEGRSLLTAWGYLGGFQTGYIPEGRERAVLNGGFYFTIESHLFATREGAADAYTYVLNLLKDSKSKQVTPAGLFGEQQSAWELVDGKVQTSSIDAVYHRYVLRRGNVLVVVLTYGAQGFMKLSYAEAAAKTIDDKILGRRPAAEPTPVNTPRPTPTPTRIPLPTPR